MEAIGGENREAFLLWLFERRVMEKKGKWIYREGIEWGNPIPLNYLFVFFKL